LSAESQDSEVGYVAHLDFGVEDSLSDLLGYDNELMTQGTFCTGKFANFE
jgi:hypothetical protein